MYGALFYPGHSVQAGLVLLRVLHSFLGGSYYYRFHRRSECIHARSRFLNQDWQIEANLLAPYPNALQRFSRSYLLPGHLPQCAESTTFKILTIHHSDRRRPSKRADGCFDRELAVVHRWF